MDALRRLLKSRLFLVAAAVALLVGLYAVLGFYAAPGIVRNQAIDFVRDKYARELTIGHVGINPFKLQAEINDLALPDADGTPMLGFRRLFIDFEASSLWHRAFVFRDITLEAPTVRAVIHPDGSVNLADLALPDDAEKTDEPLPSVWVKSFRLSDGAINALNHLRRTPVERHFAPVTFSLDDFKTTPEGGGFGLRARSRNDEVFEWSGRFALEPEIASSGTFSITDIKMAGIAELLGDDLPFGLPRGEMDLAGTYDLALGDTLRLDVKLPKIAVADLALRARGVDEDWVEIPALIISDTQVALPAQTVSLGEIVLDNLQARVWFNEDGSLNTDQLFAPAPAAEAVADPAVASAAGGPAAAAVASSPGAAAGAPTAPAETAPWTLTVGSVALRDSAIDFEDRTVQPAARFALAPFNLTLRQASLDLAQPLPLEFDAAINGAARVSGQGQLVPEPLAADVEVRLAGLQMQELQPYANGTTDLTIRSGTIDAAGKFGLAPPGAGRPEMSFVGDVTLAGFRSTDNALEQDFVNFERVELSKLSFALAPDALSIDRVRVVQPFARVIISSDQVINVSAVLDPQGTAAAVATAKAEAAAKAAEASRKKTRAELRAEKAAAKATAKARAASPVAPAPDLEETGMPIRIRQVAVVKGTMDFADYSIQPNFAAAIRGLDGTISGLSTDPNSRANVQLAGKVGDFSPVHIDGTVQLFAYDRHTDIGLKFENITLPVFNPYSGKFAGYNIAKGKLTTDLHYKIDNRQLSAQHKVRIDQLEWGEASATQGEATLPVKFATSLLKDGDGVITLDIPVTGTLDDPAFRIGPIVWQVVKNLLTKVVTAPFKALGALFQGAEEAQFVDFAPGAASLDPAAAERLAALGKSLAPKQELTLDIPVGIEPELDAVALSHARYEQELAASVTSVLSGEKGPKEGSAPPAFATLEPEQQIAALTALYARLAGAPPAVPALPEPAEGTSRKEAKLQAQQAAVRYLEDESRKRVVALPGDLEALGQKRAEAVQHAVLTETGLPPERVFLARNGKVAANGQSVRFELSVK